MVDGGGNTATAARREVTTGGDGRFVAALLPPTRTLTLLWESFGRERSTDDKRRVSQLAAKLSF